MIDTYHHCSQTHLGYLFKQSASLKQFLTPSLLKSTQNSSGTVPCSQLRCKLCKFINTHNQIFGASGFKYNIKRQYNCKTTNVLYAISYTNFPGKLYIGETGQFLRKFIISNRSDIMHHCNKSVANHIN